MKRPRRQSLTERTNTPNRMQPTTRHAQDRRCNTTPHKRIKKFTEPSRPIRTTKPPKGAAMLDVALLLSNMPDGNGVRRFSSIAAAPPQPEPTRATVIGAPREEPTPIITLPLGRANERAERNEAPEPEPSVTVPRA